MPPTKLQGFFVLKLETKRLREKKYKIHISLDEARKNNELVRLGDSELLRAIRRIRAQEFVQESLDLLLKQKKSLARKPNTPENRKNIREVADKIDETLFVKDIIILTISDVRHYKKIIDEGLCINNRKFSRLLCGAGHARRSSVIFASDEILPELSEFLECGRNKEEMINPNKFSAYHALASSATHVVSRPTFVVISDYELEKTVNVDWFISKLGERDPVFEPRTITQKFNIFDGQGLISVTQAQIWAEDLGLDWLPSGFIFRAAFAKGLLVTFDFHKFAYECGIREITDIYGNKHLLDDIEVILSESQFKMANAYKDLDEYNNACRQREFEWGVSRYTPKKDKDNATCTYQYLQALDIPESKIDEICAPTIDWLKKISGLGWEDVCIFLLGEIDHFTAEDFRQADYLAKAIILEPECLKDSHIKKKLFRLINKKIRESYIGILNVNGNYQFLVADPVAQAQHAFGQEVTGIVNKGTAYSEYWSRLGINQVSCFRSPMTWRSEHLVLDLDHKPGLERWFEYQYSNIIFNIYDDWMMRLSGADVDGDIVMTTPSFVDCNYPNLNIPTYERKSADKQVINNTSLWESDTLSFGSKIGLITNFGTTFFSMLSEYKEQDEQDLLINRLKSCNVFQNMQIDKTKGIFIYPLPSWWDKWNKEGENVELYNRLLARQRPYFMRYIYSSHNKYYRHHYTSYDNICNVRFGYSLEELLKKDVLSEEEQKVKEEFFTRSPLIDSPSIMNMICHHMEDKVKEIRVVARGDVFDYHTYMNSEISIDVNKLNKMAILYEKWVTFNRNIHDRSEETENEEETYSKDEYIKILEREAYSISNNLRELTNLLVEVCYGRHGENSKEFCWKMFGADGIIKNLLERSRGFVQVPLVDNNGTHEYLSKKYSLENIVLEQGGA